MAEFPALPLWTDSYLADTMHLDCMESGAYLHLLISAWRSPDCSLPNDDKLLARFAKCSPTQWKRIKPAVLEFWTLSENKWEQKRLKKERDWVSNKRKKQSQAGKASALKKKETGSTDEPDTLQQNANEATNETATPTPTPIPTPIPKKKGKKKDIVISGGVSEIEPFDIFWQNYPKQRKGGQNKAKYAWNRALKDKRADADTILEGLSRYVNSREVLDGFAKGAAGWLNDDRWANDYTPPNPQGGGQGQEIRDALSNMAREIENNE